MNNLRNINSLREKYKFEEYDDRYPDLYDAERDRILQKLAGKVIKIQHFGSTAIKNVGGKGVIDILIESNQPNIQEVSEILTREFGYEYRKSGSYGKRLFHQIEVNGRRYHIHLVSFNDNETVKVLAFRDFLIQRPDLAREYSEIKRLASNYALKMNTKKDMKQIYMSTKKPAMNKIVRIMKAGN